VQGDEAGLEVLSQEGAALRGGPFYAGLGDGDLDIGGVGDVLEEIEQLADWTAWLAGRGHSTQHDSAGIPNLAVLALAKDDSTVLLVVMRSTSSFVFLWTRRG
jgi:hypothetical protein